MLEIILPNEAVVLKRCFGGEDDCFDKTTTTIINSSSNDGVTAATTTPTTTADNRSDNSSSSGGGVLAQGIQSVVLDPAPECVTKLLALSVDHIDTLLEDW